MICVLTLLSCVPTSAQSKDITAGLVTNFSFIDDEFKVIDLGIDIGYYFTDKFFGFFRYGESVGLFKQQKRDYALNSTFGTSLGYDVYEFEGGILDVRIGVGNTLMKKDWRYNYYDANINFNVNTGRVKPSFGIGVRYYNTYKSLYDDYVRAYMTLGFKFN